MFYLRVIGYIIQSLGDGGMVTGTLVGRSADSEYDWKGCGSASSKFDGYVEVFGDSYGILSWRFLICQRRSNGYVDL